MKSLELVTLDLDNIAKYHFSLKKKGKQCWIKQYVMGPTNYFDQSFDENNCSFKLMRILLGLHEINRKVSYKVTVYRPNFAFI